jgi:hypothetical protein
MIILAHSPPAVDERNWEGITRNMLQIGTFVTRTFCWHVHDAGASGPRMGDRSAASNFLSRGHKGSVVQFSLFVTNGQIAVFDPAVNDPFNDWTELHFDQGFSWRHRSVSFRTLVDSGEMDVEVGTSEAFVPADGAVRSICVPFDAPLAIEIATISESRSVETRSGLYELYFETGATTHRPWCRITLVPSNHPTARILLADSALRPSYPLLLDENPA